MSTVTAVHLSADDFRVVERTVPHPRRPHETPPRILHVVQRRLPEGAWVDAFAPLRTREHAWAKVAAWLEHDGPTAWLFNGEYDDLDQVHHAWPEYITAMNEVGRNGFAYNSDLMGRIPSIAGPTEETGVYLLQKTGHEVRDYLATLALLDDGYEWVDDMEPNAVIRGDVVLVPTGRGPGEVYEGARLIAGGDGKPHAVLPKGARTNGYSARVGRVLVKR